MCVLKNTFKVEEKSCFKHKNSMTNNSWLIDWLIIDIGSYISKIFFEDFYLIHLSFCDLGEAILKLQKINFEDFFVFRIWGYFCLQNYSVQCVLFKNLSHICGYLSGVVFHLISCVLLLNMKCSSWNSHMFFSENIHMRVMSVVTPLLHFVPLSCLFESSLLPLTLSLN